MKLRRTFAGGKSILRQQRRVIEVHGRVEASAARIDIDHIEILSAWSRFQLLPWNLDGDLADRRCLKICCQAWIDRERAQAAKWRISRSAACRAVLGYGLARRRYRHRLRRGSRGFRRL